MLTEEAGFATLLHVLCINTGDPKLGDPIHHGLYDMLQGPVPSHAQHACKNRVICAGYVEGTSPFSCCAGGCHDSIAATEHWSEDI